MDAPTGIVNRQGDNYLLALGPLRRFEEKQKAQGEWFLLSREVLRKIASDRHLKALALVGLDHEQDPEHQRNQPD